MITAEDKRRVSALETRLIETGKKIGNTPLLEISSRISGSRGVSIYAKQEWKQLGGSVKARAGYAIIKNAIQTGRLDENTVLLDATSGNTGIAYAAIAREIGLAVTLCLPENASRERKEILRSLGVNIIFTSPFEGTDGAQVLARSMAEQEPEKYFYADQYKNDNNWRAHYDVTASEIYNETPGMTHFVAGLGTTGTFVGTGRRLRELNPDIRLISLQPDSALHGLEGWKHLETAIVPAIYDASVADENLEVSTEEAYAMIQKIFEVEGLLLSPSSAANVVGAVRIASTIKEGTIVTVLPDNADKYSEVIKKLIQQ